MKKYNYLNQFTSKDETWDSGLVITSPTIYIPQIIEATCDAIQANVNNNEFSILCKGAFDKDGFVLSSEYLIPKQKVGMASVDYEEDISLLKAEGWNVVIHSHPFSKGSTFSQSDMDSINSHFPCSILYAGNGFVLASLLLPISEEMKIMIMTSDIQALHPPIPEIENFGNITESYSYPTGTWSKNKYTPAKEDDFLGSGFYQS